jgi:CHRD domain-containing protein
MKSRNRWIRSGLIAAAGLLFAWSYATAGDSKEKKFHTRLEGAQETPAISTAATGTFEATLNSAGDQLSYELEYSGLEGGNTLFAHVHIGQFDVAGGVMFFLCGGGGKPACPNGSATVTGTVTAADIIGPAGQGITAGQFDEAIRAMRDGIAYANVHTVTYPTGEIRGQINRRGR